MSLTPPEPPPPPIPERTAAEGPWGGPSFGDRGATIHCAKGGHVCGLRLDGHPLDGRSFGALGTVTPPVDLWVEERRLPACMRAVPKG